MLKKVMEKFCLNIVWLALFVSVSCSDTKSPMLPENMRGTWHQEAKEEYRLRLEQQPNKSPQAFLSVSGDGWFGPLDLHLSPEGKWVTKVIPIIQSTEYNTTKLMPPVVQEDMQYIETDQGQILLHSYNTILQEGVVTIHLEGPILLVENLWAQIEVVRYTPAPERKPAEQKITPKTISFVRSDAVATE